MGRRGDPSPFHDKIGLLRYGDDRSWEHHLDPYRSSPFCVIVSLSPPFLFCCPVAASRLLQAIVTSRFLQAAVRSRSLQTTVTSCLLRTILTGCFQRTAKHRLLSAVPQSTGCFQPYRRVQAAFQHTIKYSLLPAQASGWDRRPGSFQPDSLLTGHLALLRLDHLLDHIAAYRAVLSRS